jgi:hypothetical protein
MRVTAMITTDLPPAKRGKTVAIMEASVQPGRVSRIWRRGRWGCLTFVEYVFDDVGMGAEMAQATSLAPPQTPVSEEPVPAASALRGRSAPESAARGLAAHGAAVPELAAVTGRKLVAPGERVLPVLPPLRGLLAAGGLPRGHVVATGTWGLLCLALAAGASHAGAWCAVVGLPSLGVLAAADLGLDPGRLLLIAEPGGSWPQVVASLLDGCDLVLLRPPDRPSAQLRRKLEAVARRHGSVLLVAGEWDGAQARLRVARHEWAGLGAGHGRLRARKAEVVAEGRGTRPRSQWLWLPGPDGAVTTVADTAGVGLASTG